MDRYRDPKPNIRWNQGGKHQRRRVGRVVGVREAEDTIQTWATESTKQYSEGPTETEVTHMDPVCFLTRSFAYMYICIRMQHSILL